jgi:gluconolactonase
MPEGSLGNGIRFSSDETMFIADYIGHKILKYDSKGDLSVFAHEPSTNGPNDVAIMDNVTCQKF